MKVGLYFSAFNVQWPELRDLWLAADRLGFDSVGMMDNVVGPLPVGTEVSVMESYTALAAGAGLSERLELGPLVTPAGRHAPAIVAKMGCVVDHISGGRFRLGLGVADEERHFLPWGIPFPSWSARTAQLKETIEVVRRLWSEPITNYDGDHYQLRDAILEPKPVRPGGIPIWLGVIGPNNRELLAIAGQHADGVNIFHASDEGVAEIRESIEASAEQCGRDPTQLSWSRLVGVSLAERPAEGDQLDAVIEAVARRSGPWAQDLRDFFSRCEQWIIGPPDYVAERLGQQADLGFDEVVLELSFDPEGVLRSGSGQRELLEQIAEKVLPVQSR